ncbi:MAG TPA: 2-oxoglutarate and iron-dependent oxygenase domain-containing protein [Reyranella sp.]|nr:2-oxoglutarate and iron-dependent oxygenase domain-containing protein [Reyranella sp.]
MDTLTSRSIDLRDIPVLDLADADRARLHRAMHEACAGVGFFYIRNHGVPAPAIEGIFEQAHRFFELPEAEREAIRLTDSPWYRGYLPTGAPGANTVTRANLLEAFNLARELGPDDPAVRELKPLHGPNQWPAEESLPGFRAAVLDYYTLMEDLSGRVLRVLCGAMGIDERALLPKFAGQLGQLRLLYYPAQPVVDDIVLGVRPHHDTSFMTMLVQDDAGGLEVQNRDGEWLVVPPRPDMFVVNVGSYLECLSSGVYTAAKHRVVNRSGRRRYSIPFFFSPNFDVTVEPDARFAKLPGSTSPAPMNVGQDMIRFFDTLFPAVADKGGGPHDKYRTVARRVVHKMAEGYGTP